MKLPNTMLHARRWHGVMLGVVVVAVLHLGAPTSAGMDEPWPALLSSDGTLADPTVALLHRRAVEALNELAPAGAAQPL
jgi:hypothetical protein